MVGNSPQHQRASSQPLADTHLSYAAILEDASIISTLIAFFIPLICPVFSPVSPHFFTSSLQPI